MSRTLLIDPKKVGERIADARKAADLTQEEMAAAADLSLNGYGNYERGVNRRLDIAKLAGIAKRAGVTLDWLVSGTGPRQPVEEGAAAAKLEAIRRILSEPDLPSITQPMISEDSPDQQR